MTARGRLRLLANGHTFSLPVYERPSVPGGTTDLARVVAALELKTQVLQPVEVLDAAVAVGPDLLVVGLAGHRDQVLVHLLGTVVVTGGLLHGGASAEVEVPAGHRGGSPCGGRPLEHQHPGARCSGAHRRASAGDAETDHHDVDFVRPVLSPSAASTPRRDISCDSLLLLLHVVEERPDLGRDVRDL